MKKAMRKVVALLLAVLTFLTAFPTGVLASEVVTPYVVPGDSTFSLDGGDGTAETAETPELNEYSVVINYVFEDNEIVADPYTATLAAGSNFSATITHPTVQGYLPYVGTATETSTSIELNITGIDRDVTYTVTYKPTNVNYTVIHYQQNLDNDKYTEYERVTLQGLTGSDVPDNIVNEYPGFYALLYEEVPIAADGLTVVEIYYDRNYYKMIFDMDGGYGTEPIYDRYGADIGEVTEPTKAGYTFAGWALVNADGTTTKVDELPKTMPAGDVTYKALWTANDKAKVSVVIWGENADDEGYSYLETAEVYATPGVTITYQNAFMSCGVESHSHTDECFGCGHEEHTHSDDCYDCGETSTSHAHSISCYSGVYSDYTAQYTRDFPQNVSNGYVHSYYGSKYIYINGTWYYYYGNTDSGKYASATCGQTESTHTHSDECSIKCGLSEHTHSSECYSCGKTEHEHSDSCYSEDAVEMDTSLWTYVKSDEVTVAADGSTVMNVYYDRTTFTLTFKDGSDTVATITDKWGANISGEFSKAPFNTTYNGRAWECTESSKYDYALQTLDIMPQFNATFNLYNKSSNTLKTIYYYVENVGANVSHDTWPTSTTNFTLLKTVTTYFNWATYEEEYHEMEGFTRYSKSVSGFSGNTKDFSNNEMYLYYLRNSYTLDFNNGEGVVKSETVEYEASLGSFDTYVPECPSYLEAGAYEFAGWYLNPECTGEEFVLTDEKMPCSNLILYAKWAPVNRTVEFYLDYNAYDAGTKIGETHPDLIVPHGSKVESVPATPKNGSYTFIGWFYMDNGVEKAFDFASMPVTKDMKVYGKWSSNVLKEYTVYFKIQGTDTQIADPITGSALAGITKTFEAKGNEELYTEYQAGYFPLVQSHSITLDIEDETNNTFTFWYVQKDAVPYTVYYVSETPLASYGNTQTIERNGKTYYLIADAYTNSENRKAVVTEKFKPVSGYMPDAYQKRLVVIDGAENEIIFYYTKDTKHAYYKITHYTQNTDGNTWTEYATSQAVGEINKEYSAQPLDIDGFTYKAEISKASGTLTADGLELKLYYTRNSYPYMVRYLEQGTGKELHDPKTTDCSGLYGDVVSESAIDITNYTAVDPTSQTLTIKIEQGETPQLNIITFYYTENEVTINYVVVGPTGCGTVDPTSEKVKAVTGTAQGSTAAANQNYKFVGWYSDAACTTQVSTDAKYVPTKAEGAAWVDGTTFYAKFELDATDVKLTKKVSGNVGDKNKEFKFAVTVNDKTVTLDKTTLKDGEWLTIPSVPFGATVKITESGKAGYKIISVTLNGSEVAEAKVLDDKDENTTGGIVINPIEGATSYEIVITNDKTITVDTGILLDSLPYVVLLALVGAGLAFMVIRRRRRED